MAYKVTENNINDRLSIQEQYENEIANEFLEADDEAGEEVEVIYMIDDRTGEDLELWRKDWMIERLIK